MNGTLTETLLGLHTDLSWHDWSRSPIKLWSSRKVWK